MILRFVFGVLLGVFYFGGLKLTVAHLLTRRHPFAVTLGSLFLRTAVVATGFFFVMGDRWQNAVVALLGFTAARFVLPRQRSGRCT